MKSICFFNNKGGVGKTTLLCNLAASLAIYKDKKILIIDADPQCNSSSYLLPEDQLEVILEEEQNDLGSFYKPIRDGNRSAISNPKTRYSERFHVDLIVGSPKLSLTEDFLAKDWLETMDGESRGFGTTFAFAELLEMNNNYDYIFIDMGPSLGALNRSILLSSDYFIMPLSVDIFSTMAISNITNSFANWKESLDDALKRYTKKNTETSYKLRSGNSVSWKLNFLGYVRQLYKAKSVRGERQYVKSYERIIDKQNQALLDLKSFFNIEKSLDKKLGDIQTLNSLIPLSQQAHAPIFELGAKDGIVGAHYSSVSDAKKYFDDISSKFLDNL